MTKVRINSDALQAVYKKWLDQYYPAGHPFSWGDHIDRVNLKYTHGKAFDEFVWTCGGHIRQENSRRFLEFFNDEDATMFMLRWS
jgi:hypothetical protein